ncbi:Rieske 2Fe-2S domain-containing protein [Saccharobesus litoralis]|nr:Rieske 2Fe-2S domain-containing protein [Saccharobesus litoralis]
MANELNVFYPAAGKCSARIKIEQVKETANPDVLVGKAQLPLTDHVGKVVIYKTILQDGSIDLRAVSAYCPHQGYDISKDPLKADGNVYCSLHRRPICIYSEYNQAFAVENSGDEYWIIEN